MKFLIDADCPRSIEKSLKESKYDVSDIRDIKPNATDQEIYELIKRDSLILITRDTDFGNILRYPVAPNYGIILLRVHLLSPHDIVSIINDVISRISEKELLGSLTVVRKNRYRIHRF